MNQKEAIEQLENLLGHCESMANRDSHVWDADCQALKLAIAALRPISREQGYDCRRTAYNLQRLADMDKTSPGRVVDKLVRDRMIELRRYQDG